MKVNDVVELEVYPEYCCEMCGDIVHNHIDCPVCETEYASTDRYIELDELDSDENVTCDSCGSEFKLVSGSWYQDTKVQIIELGEM